MKPSEKRALEAEKRRRAEEIRLRSENPEETSEDVSLRSLQQTERNTSQHREGFIQSHIRLITFFVTVILVIFVLSPIGIDLFIANRRDKSVSGGENMTLNTVYAIHDNADNMKWSYLEKYSYTDYSYDSKNGKYLVREYSIADSRLVLKVGGSSVGTALDYAHLINYSTGDYIDVLKNDPRDFVKSIEQEE